MKRKGRVRREIRALWPFISSHLIKDKERNLTNGAKQSTNANPPNEEC